MVKGVEMRWIGKRARCPFVAFQSGGVYQNDKHGVLTAVHISNLNSISASESTLPDDDATTTSTSTVCCSLPGVLSWDDLAEARSTGISDFQN